MSIVSKLLVAAGTFCVCLVSIQSAKAASIDLGSSGTVVANTPIPFQLPDPLAAGNYDFDFIVDGQMGHIELTQLTTLNLHVNAFSIVVGGQFEYSYNLSDMNHVVLPNTHRVGDLGRLNLPIVPPFSLGQTPITDPIDPADLELGRYFHDIHFVLPAVSDIAFPPTINAALVFNQDVQLGVWVPEPGTYAALGSLAAMGLCMAYRRRKPSKK